MDNFTSSGYGDIETWGGRVPCFDQSRLEEIEDKIISDEQLNLDAAYEYLAATEIGDLSDEEYAFFDAALLKMASILEKAAKWKAEKELKKEEELKLEAELESRYF